MVKEKQNYKSLLAFAFGLLLVACQFTTAFGQDEIHETYQLSNGGRINVESLSGKVTVTSWNENYVKFDAVKRGKQGDFHKVEIRVTTNNNLLDIETIYPKRGNVNVDVDFHLKVPHTAILNSVKSVSGDVAITGPVGGSIDASSISGDVFVSDTTGTTGSVSAKSVSGKVNVKNVSGPVQISSVSGDVSISNSDGNLKADSVSGNVYVTDVESTSVKSESVSGNVKFTGVLKQDGIYLLNSHSGSVNIALPSDSEFRITAESFSGSINSDFNILSELNTNSHKHEIRGTVGKGGANLKCKAFSGSVNIKKQ